jgi:gentisate 1,2-dioxygenase
VRLSCHARLLTTELTVTSKMSHPAIVVEAEARSPQQDALYHRPTKAFDNDTGAVQPHLFADEQREALNPRCSSGLIELNLARQFGSSFAASTPSMLARYVIVRSNRSLSHRFIACGEIFHVIRGAGTSTSGSATISWRLGDVFCFPGGMCTTHNATQDSLLLCVTNEPALAYQGLDAPDYRRNPVTPVHFVANLIDEHLSRIGPTTTSAGKGIHLVTPGCRATNTVTPTLAVAVNSLEPGGDQRPHRHNAAALTLPVSFSGVHTLMDGKRYDWIEAGVLVTPALAVHSHHNRGNQPMKAIVFQDAGLYYHLRNVGFSFADQP